MKMIDDKGRVFGKINLFDLIVILLILVGIIGVCVRGSAPTAEEEPEVKTDKAVYTFQLDGVQENIANAFKKGDEIYENGVLLGVLSEDPVVKPYQTTELMPNGEATVVDHVLLFSTTLTLETDKFHVEKGYRIDDNEMLNGTGHVISNGFVNCNVVVTNLEPELSAETSKK